MENISTSHEVEPLVQSQTEQEPSEPDTQEQEPQQPAQQQAHENANVKNIRLLREKAELADRFKKERDELMLLLKQQAQQQQGPTVSEEEFDLNIGDDDLAEGKHLSKVAKEVKKIKQQLKGFQQQTAESVVETRLRTQYPDFEQVVSLENVKALSSAYPEIASTLNADPNLFNKAVSTYQMIKKLGIQPQEDLYVQEREVAQRNAAKPRPLTSVSPQQGDSPISKANAFANGLTDELKKQLQKEMMEAKKNY